MKIVRIGIISLVLLTLVLSGCSSGNKSETAKPLKELTATEFYNQISPSIAYITSPAGSGSGLLITGGYIVTCAHVVWPFENVSVVFPNSSEIQAQVLNYDLLADIAVLKPVSVNISPLALAPRGNLSVGAPVFAIGYPGENKEHHQPTLSQGMISTFRSWDTLNLTYIQTDAAGSFGQSGGGLFSNKGELLGMLGYSFTSSFHLAFSATNLSSRVGRLINGEDVASLGSRLLPSDGGQKKLTLAPAHWWDSKIFVIRQPAGTHIDIKATSTQYIEVSLTDANGYQVDYDNTSSGTASVSTTTEYDAPYFLSVEQISKTVANIQLSSSCDLIPFTDRDDGKEISAGDTVLASLDYPGDGDYYSISLLEGQRINISVDSLMIDPYIGVFPSDLLSLKLKDWGNVTWFDDDSGGGLFGTNAYLELTAPKKGTYIIGVTDSNDEYIGGYILTVKAAD